MSNLHFIDSTEIHNLPSPVVTQINGLKLSEVAFAYIYMSTEKEPIYFVDPLHLRRGHHVPKIGSLYVATHIVFSSEDQFELFRENVNCKIERVDSMSDTEELKMWLVVRGDIQMSMGKLAAQAGHGFCTALREATVLDSIAKATGNGGYTVEEYFQNSQPKITVVAKNLAALERVHRECTEASLPCSFITDEGRTEFPEPTATVVGIGPCRFSELPKYVQRLRLL